MNKRGFILLDTMIAWSLVLIMGVYVLDLVLTSVRLSAKTREYSKMIQVVDLQLHAEGIELQPNLAVDRVSSVQPISSGKYVNSTIVTFSRSDNSQPVVSFVLYE